MQIHQGIHLTYCTNIHPGESWEEVFQGLQEYVPALKASLAQDQPFGIGLRLSNQASKDILVDNALSDFKSWLERHNCYVFTMNGFPYGGFHGQVVKDLVHQPDWTTAERVAYTQRLFRILQELLPEGLEGGISTSPLSYKHWLSTEEEKNTVFEQATANILQVLHQLVSIYEDTQQVLHLDIEPEPDGLLENSAETHAYYAQWLIPKGTEFLTSQFGYTPEASKEVLLRHIQLCYDVCHFAIAYEDHAQAIKGFTDKGIRIGKFQLSAALKADFRTREAAELQEVLATFNESTYLHQVIARDLNNSLIQYPDLPQALQNDDFSKFQEWRIHFHVPVFLSDYQVLSSTQGDIIEVLEVVREALPSQHLEVETYTWGVLPEDAQIDLKASIERELQWVLHQFRGSV